MRVLHIVAGNSQGGAETHCLDMIKALHEAGIHQHVICRPHARYLELLRALAIGFDTMNFSAVDRLVRGPRLIRNRVTSFQPDVIHAWMRRAASFVPKRAGVAVLGWFGGYYKVEAFKRCDCYIGVSRDIARYIGEQTGRHDRTFVVHTFGTLDPEPPIVRSSLDTPADVPVVLLLSRMHQSKGVDTLLRAAAQIGCVHFWLAGDGPEFAAYQALARELKLTDRVHFLGWRLDRAALFGAADLCVLPSRYEPFGTVMSEAWHSRVPLVAAKAAGPRQYITHDENGLLCAVDDPDDLAHQIRRGLFEPELRRRLVENGTKTYEALFTKEVAVRSLLETYQRARDLKAALHPRDR